MRRVRRFRTVTLSETHAVPPSVPFARRRWLPGAIEPKPRPPAPPAWLPLTPDGHAYRLFSGVVVGASEWRWARRGAPA